jgi:spore coat protein U-like protein
MNYLKSYLAIAAILCLASPFVTVNAARAATATGTLGVSGVVVVGGACTVGASSFDFGAYSGVALSGSGTVSVTCPSGLAYTVDLSATLNTTLSSVQPRLHGSGGYLPYNLYQDAGHTLVWGLDNGGTAKAGTGTGAAQNITVYGNIPAQPIAPGTYTDTVGVTVSF